MYQELLLMAPLPLSLHCVYGNCNIVGNRN